MRSSRVRTTRSSRDAGSKDKTLPFSLQGVWIVVRDLLRVRLLRCRRCSMWFGAAGEVICRPCEEAGSEEGGTAHCEQPGATPHGRTTSAAMGSARPKKSYPWRRGVRAALDERRRMRACASTPGGPEAAGNTDMPPHIDDRAVWRAVLDAESCPSLAPVLRFCLATWDGTGQVERGLGLDAHIVGRHLGSHETSSGGDDLSSGLLELKLQDRSWSRTCLPAETAHEVLAQLELSAKAEDEICEEALSD